VLIVVDCAHRIASKQQAAAAEKAKEEEEEEENTEADNDLPERIEIDQSQFVEDAINAERNSCSIANSHTLTQYTHLHFSKKQNQTILTT
jgi:hypothetical protein